MSVELTWTVQVSESERESLEEFSEERIIEELENTLSELASVQEKQSELRDRRPESSSGNETEELSGAALEQALRDYLRGKRDTDPRLD